MQCRFINTTHDGPECKQKGRGFCCADPVGVMHEVTDVRCLDNAVEGRDFCTAHDNEWKNRQKRQKDDKVDTYDASTDVDEARKDNDSGD